MRPPPVEHEPGVAAARLRVVRILVAGYAAAFCVLRLPHLVALADYREHRYRPVGIMNLLTDRPLGPALWYLVLAAAIGSSLAFANGWRPRLSGPVAALTVLAVATYRSSWGQLFHTEHLLVLHMVVLGGAFTLPRRDDRLVLRLLAVVTVTTYLVSGWAKLRIGGLDWLDGETLRNQVAYDNVRKEVLGAPSSPLAGLLVPHAWLFPPLAVATMALELGAPFALIGPRVARWWAAAAWLFHAGVAVVMAIVFAYPLTGVAFAPLLPVERLARHRGAPGADAAPVPGRVGAT